MPESWLSVKSAPVIFCKKKNNALTYYGNDSTIAITTDNIILIVTKGGETMSIKYKKFEPTEYVMKVKNGEIVQEGLGLSFFYNTRTTSMMVLSTTAFDTGFAFDQIITSDFQSVSVGRYFLYYNGLQESGADGGFFLSEYQKRKGGGADLGKAEDDKEDFKSGEGLCDKVHQHHKRARRYRFRGCAGCGLKRKYEEG